MLSTLARADGWLSWWQKQTQPSLPFSELRKKGDTHRGPRAPAPPHPQSQAALRCNQGETLACSWLEGEREAGGGERTEQASLDQPWTCTSAVATPAGQGQRATQGPSTLKESYPHATMGRRLSVPYSCHASFWQMQLHQAISTHTTVSAAVLCTTGELSGVDFAGSCLGCQRERLRGQRGWWEEIRGRLLLINPAWTQTGPS